MIDRCEREKQKKDKKLMIMYERKRDREKEREKMNECLTTPQHKNNFHKHICEIISSNLNKIFQLNLNLHLVNVASASYT